MGAAGRVSAKFNLASIDGFGGGEREGGKGTKITDEDTGEHMRKCTIVVEDKKAQPCCTWRQKLYDEIRTALCRITFVTRASPSVSPSRCSASYRASTRASRAAATVRILELLNALFHQKKMLPRHNQRKIDIEHKPGTGT